jgi:hypothetical protein
MPVRDNTDMNKWISVKDRLPPFAQKVLVYHIGEEIYSFANKNMERQGAHGVMQAERQPSGISDGVVSDYWTWYTSEPCYRTPESITHWMPLPEGPCL